MTDKFSSPSSASSGAQRDGNDSRILIQKQPPSHVFIEEEFELQYVIEGHPIGTSPSDMFVQAILETTTSNVLQDPSQSIAAYHKQEHDESSLPVATLDVVERRQSPATQTTPSVTWTLCCKINHAGRHKHEAAYKIQLVTGHDVTPAVTRTIQLVHAKIHIETTPDWSNIWYKDEGGRDKCIDLIVSAFDQDKKPLKEKIPLSLTLYYATDDPIRVMNQDILRLIGSEKRLLIDKTTGKAKVRFRIEDVSKNHQGHDFVLQVGADSRIYRDIAPAVTQPISVRSKRNKRHRPSIDSRARLEGQRASPSMMAAGEHPHLTLDGSDTEPIIDAMHNVMRWADDVYNALHPLQWQVLGYARNEDGSPDFSRPYHSMYNPNPVISRLRSTYMESTFKQLQIVEQALCRSSPTAGGPGDPAFAPRSGAGMIPQEQYWMPQHHGPLPPPMMHPFNMPPRYGPDASYEEALQHTQGFYAPRPHMPPPMVAAGPRYDDSMHPHRGHPWQSQQQAHPHHQSPPHGMVHPTLSQSDSKPPAGIPREAEQRTKTVDVEHDNENLEEDVEYVLAKQYKSLHTRKKLGFPAFSLAKKLIGFYNASSHKVGGGRFVPVHQVAEEFESPEIQHQATSILQEAIDTKSETLHSLRDWGSINNLLDHVFVYEWSKDISEADDHAETM
jgi:hypothetical protein